MSERDVNQGGPMNRRSETRRTAMRGMRNAMTAMLLTAVCIAPAAPALAQSEADRAGDVPNDSAPAPIDGRAAFLLVDRELNVRAVNVIELNPAAVLFDDAAGQREALPLDDVLLLMRDPSIGPPSADAAQSPAAAGPRDENDGDGDDDSTAHSAAAGAPPPAGLLVLADGRRLPGDYDHRLMDDAPPDHIRWRHPWLGVLDVPLEQIASIAFIASAAPPAPAAGDVIRLENGDALTGFILEINSAIGFELEDGGRIDIPIHRVESLSLVNPPAVPNGMRLWFDDGTVIGARSARFGDDRVLRIDGPLLSPMAGSDESPSDLKRLELAHLRAIELRPAALVGLAELDDPTVERIEPRYVLPKPQRLSSDSPAGLDAVAISGPIKATWTLPRGAQGSEAAASRFAARAVLPESARAYGCVELIIAVDGDEVFRARIDGEHPVREINVPLAGRTLSITLASAGDGPVQDVIHLQRPMILQAR